MENSIKNVVDDYQKFRDEDPFPEIPPALLNSADIKDYVTKTKLVEPFYENDLKPASYGIRLKGEFLYWNTKEDRVYNKTDNLTEKDEDGHIVFILKKNSIAFVQLEPHFRLPVYIAARFNLRIKHIYQGLLVGTGPLVDPGFDGNLYVPLHNLTDNDYRIKINEPFIWMEFTKISPNQKWNSLESRNAMPVIFGKDKYANRRTLPEYINEAHPNAPIISTIPAIIDENKKLLEQNIIENRKVLGDYEQRILHSESSVKGATEATNKATTAFNRAILVSIIAIGVTLFITVFQTMSIHYKTIDYLKDYDKKQQEQFDKYIGTENEIIELNRKILDLQKLQNKNGEKQVK